MYLGFLSVCLGDISFEEKVKWAAENGFHAMEVGCWPTENQRDYASSDLSVSGNLEKEAARVQNILDLYQMKITSLAFYDNNLDADLVRRKRNNLHLLRCIDLAALLGVPTVGTFIGKDYTKSIEENFTLFEEIFHPIVAYAFEKKVNIVVENCPMEGWQQQGVPGTISFSPELWEEMFRRIPEKNFGLNYDPSHMYIMQMDYLSPIKTFRDRILHVHAKDAWIDKEKLSYYGTYNRQLNRKLTNGYWNCRMPGRGGVDFEKFISELKGIDYNGVISIEHEDPDFEGDLCLVKKALLMAQDYLKKWI
ncbi:sugar phosphate isomerase/epimerase family protein [Yeguia hominis]|uniref:Sugar phosphate isomerase/epimerase n=1 Tax=Yeguia hominis TaxID=2763662 RepID=A0A926DBV8_9FIRM|nr:sugar phosphate isomerase/epimerase [Yeguia hominis]MBC8534969.1 sugar phosphate isomerase/epimerase [Yeguia hominis]